MLDAPLHQAAGLIKIAGQPSMRVLAVVSHGDEQAEMPLLLRLCTNLATLGYPTVVLDGTSLESADNPGLEQALQDCGPDWAGHEHASWHIVSAALGLQTLIARNRGMHSWSDITHLFGHGTVVVLYANAATLTPLMLHSDIRPLVALSHVPTSVMTSYVAIKRILTKGHMQPVVVHVVHNPSNTQVSPTQGLQDYTRQFLQFEFQAIDLHIANAEDDSADGDLQRLALGLLESAINVTPEWQQPPMLLRPATPVTSSAGSH